MTHDQGRSVMPCTEPAQVPEEQVPDEMPVYAVMDRLGDLQVLSLSRHYATREHKARPGAKMLSWTAKVVKW